MTHVLTHAGTVTQPDTMPVGRYRQPVKPITGAATVALALILTACSGSSSGGGTGATADAPADTVTQPADSGCAAVPTFMSDLETSGPHAQEQLVADAQAVQQGSSGRLLTDATDLAAYVGSSSWTSEGNVNSPQVQRVQADCP